PVDDSIVSRVRAAPFQGKLRVVLDLREPATLASLTPAGHELTAVLATTAAAATPQATAQPIATASPAPGARAPAPAARVGTAAVSSKTPTPGGTGATERVNLPAAATLSRADGTAAEARPEATKPAGGESAARRVFLADATLPSSR